MAMLLLRLICPMIFSSLDLSLFSVSLWLYFPLFSYLPGKNHKSHLSSPLTYGMIYAAKFKTYDKNSLMLTKAAFI